MTKLIAETAWHHEGDYSFMKNLVTKICELTKADVVKLHITLDIDEYMSKDHEAYDTLKSWMLAPNQWEELIRIIRNSGKDIMLLLNDTKAVNFASKFNPEFVELHSVSLNVPRLQSAVKKIIDKKSTLVIGIGGCSLEEVEAAIESFDDYKTLLMFGFQNYPTRYKDVNLKKIRRIQSLYPNHIYGYADHTAWNEKLNQLITLMVASNGMDFVEKHVTTAYGEKRCDFSAAISIEQFNQLHEKIKLLNSIAGTGELSLNKAEEEYSVYGPMKMAALAKRNLVKGTKIQIKDFHFCRTSQVTTMSQLDLLNSKGNTLTNDLKINHVMDWKYFREK
jgi:N,N'-diacetyllegionaminate synthase